MDASRCYVLERCRCEIWCSCSCEEFVSEVGAGQELIGVVDLAVDGIKTLLEVSNFSLIDSQSFGLDDIEGSEGRDLLLTGGNLDLDLFPFLLEVLHLGLVSCHLAGRSDEMPHL